MREPVTGPPAPAGAGASERSGTPHEGRPADGFGPGHLRVGEQPAESRNGAAVAGRAPAQGGAGGCPAKVWAELGGGDTEPFGPDERAVLLRLLEGGRLTREQAAQALQAGRQHGTRLLDILSAMGCIRPRDYAAELARVTGRTYASELVDTEHFAPDFDLIRSFDPAALVRHRFCPLRREGERVVILAVDPDDAAVDGLVRQAIPGARVARQVGTDLDVRLLVDRAFRDELLTRSVHGLRLKHPSESASRVLSRPQKACFGALGLALLGFLLLQPTGALALLMLGLSSFYTAAIAYKLLISIAGSRDDRRIGPREEELSRLEDEELPVYSILVPNLLAALSRLDYPQEKLDVLLLLEADDHETIAAAKAARPPAHFRFIYVPEGHPRTKPKACNYGLSFCRGEYVTIYDAEDIPEPDQLKKAVLAFRDGPDNLVCVQAALNYYNSRENYLTRMFTLEYSYWFDYMVPGLHRLRLPIPLGGTSNHFRLDRLRELGAWDPFNVTEDADLGIRASARSYTVGVIDSTTYEEANKALGNWLRQRSRWIKGYMQTWLVHNRSPLPLLRTLGPARWLSYQFFVGGTCLTFLANPVMWLLFGAWALFRPAWVGDLFTDTALFLATFNFLVGNMLGIYLNMLAVFRRRLFHLTLFALTNPAYWWLHSAAAYLALWQLITKPFYWEKTQHGLTAIRAHHAVPAAAFTAPGAPEAA
jgi:cellulose synthase/poly-beta-1,6-N-acetylglucosamine synthase-like glycosyltransferase